MIRALHLIADHSRLVLTLGLLAGIMLPTLADQMAETLSLWIAFMMFAGALRLAPADVAALRNEIWQSLRFILLVQMVVPVLIALVLLACGWTGTAIGVLAVLLAAAPPIIGSANIAGLLGLDARHAMQLMLLGTLALPFTVLPVLWVLPGLGEPGAVIATVFRLLCLILLAGGGAVLCRALFLPVPTSRQSKALDGLSIAGLAIVVISLMPEVSRSAVQTPWAFIWWLALAFGLNFGLQVATRPMFRNPSTDPTAFTLGNRNLGVFFAALPVETTAPLLVFLGCYQMPMFLSPVMMRWLYKPN